MPIPNFANRTLYHGDNLEFLRGMNSETIDLIATDPPFNTGRNRSGSAGSYEDNWKWLKEGEPKPDQWRWENVVHERWLGEIQGENDGLYQVIQTTRKTHSDGTAAFLCFLGVRLLEMHRILKPTGSIYLHCDHTANSYIRMALDAIFGRRNFRNEIIWRKYAGRKNNATSKFSTQHDTIFFYSKSREAKFNVQYEPISQEEIKKKYKFTDENGRLYREAWGRHFQVTGENRRIYLDQQPGSAIGSLWVENGLQLNTSSAERTGSPDQKPLALYERIVRTSSNPGDWVLDPFCGCAITPVAAERLGRQWVGIDRRTDAEAHILNRLLANDANKGKFIPIKNGEILDEGKLNDARASVEEMNFTFTTVIPERTDEGDNAPTLETVHGKLVRRRNPYNYDQMKAILIELFGLQCWGCAFVAQDIDGHKAEQFLELDHIEPDSSGGSPEIHNRALLCTPCNRTKSDTMNMNKLRQHNGYAIGRRKGRKHSIDLRLAKIKVEDWLAKRSSQGESGATA